MFNCNGRNVNPEVRRNLTGNLKVRRNFKLAQLFWNVVKNGFKWFER